MLAPFRAEGRPVSRKVCVKALVRGEVSIWHRRPLMVERDKAFFLLRSVRAFAPYRISQFDGAFLCNFIILNQSVYLPKSFAL